MATGFSILVSFTGLLLFGNIGKTENCQGILKWVRENATKMSVCCNKLRKILEKPIWQQLRTCEEDTKSIGLLIIFKENLRRAPHWEEFFISLSQESLHSRRDINNVMKNGKKTGIKLHKYLSNWRDFLF